MDEEATHERQLREDVLLYPWYTVEEEYSKNAGGDTEGCCKSTTATKLVSVPSRAARDVCAVVFAEAGKGREAIQSEYLAGGQAVDVVLDLISVAGRLEKLWENSKKVRESYAGPYWLL